MRKLLVCLGLCLAFMTAPAMAAVNLGLPPETPVNFDGNGVFAQVPPGTFDQLGPLPAAVGTELFGVGSISGIASVADPGVPLWIPPPGLEMTFVFFDAVVSSSSRTFTGGGNVLLEANYGPNPARLLLVQDSSPDFSSLGGPSLFDLQDGEFPTAYTLEDAGYDSDGLPDAGSMFTYADDPGEEVFLDLALSGNHSSLFWDPTGGPSGTGAFLTGTFTSRAMEILGGAGASQFSDFIGPDGTAGALILTFSPAGGWAFGGDMDVQLTTVPEPATLVFLSTGLVSLIGYGIRRKMS